MLRSLSRSLAFSQTSRAFSTGETLYSLFAFVDTSPNAAGVYGILKNAATSHPHLEALRIPSQLIRYNVKQLAHEVDALASGLVEQGFVNGSNLLLWSEHPAVQALTPLAAAKCGVSLTVVKPSANASDIKWVLFCVVGCFFFRMMERLVLTGSLSGLLFRNFHRTALFFAPPRHTQEH